MPRLNNPTPQIENFDRLPDSARLRVKSVAAVVGVGVATIWRWVSEGRFPAPRKIGPNTTVWSVGQVRGFLYNEATLI